MNICSQCLLLSASLLLAGCTSGNASGPSAGESSADRPVMWEYMPQVRDASFAGSDYAWLVTEKDGDLWQTKDGGKTWTKLSGKSVNGKFRATSFIDSQRGWAANFDGQIWRTSDGGQSWSLISQPRGGEDNEASFLPGQILFLDDSNGWMIDAFAIWRTDDGGNTWNRSLSLSNNVEGHIWQPTRISFVNRNAGWMSSTAGIVHRTRDSGKSWQSKKLIPGNSDSRDIFFINEKVGWLTGFVSSTDPQPGTRLYRSEDGGESWKQISIADESTYLDSVYFLNAQEGWAVGRVSKERGKMRGIVLHTDDEGKNWLETLVGQDEPFFDRMHFVDSKHGWLLARDNVYRTQDGGKSWNIVLKMQPIKTRTQFNAPHNKALQLTAR